MSNVVRVKTLMENGTCLVEAPSVAVETCTGNCAGCGACGSRGPVRAIAFNQADAKVGDLVELEPASDRVAKQTVLIYLLPGALMIGLACIPVPNAIIRAILCFAGLIGGLIFSMKIVNRNNEKEKQTVQYAVTRIVENED